MTRLPLPVPPGNGKTTMKQAKKATPRKTADSETARQPGIMGSVMKTFEVLEVFGREWTPLTIAELGRATGRPKSSLHRTLATLVEAGVLEQSAPGRYRLTLKMWRIGISALAELDVLQVARSHLEALSRAADETVHLAVLENGGGVVYLSKVESPRSIRVQTQIGRVTPSWCTATGRALLAFNPEVRDQVLAQPKEKFTPNTVTDADELRKLFEEVARQDYAIAKAENHPEMGGIAAPIRDHSGAVIASCGVAIPIFRMDDKLIEQCTKLVTQTAATISADMGYVKIEDGARAGRISLAHS